MLTIYLKPGCPFCNKVLATLDTLELEYERKDVTSDEAILNELIEKGGQKMVPYLVDDEKGKAMYESDDIVDYLKENYGSDTPVTGEAKPRVHLSDAACTSCEG
ncbi:glutathione S-transferase N-terminal domain-containing protein [Candidatus Kaiserbacteria bacterium]|nr:glutathione S-transferase N-terminal domain-containing protein [Candidatus Kaiserbacteria bacterium]